MTTVTPTLYSIEEVNQPLELMKKFIESSQHADWSSFNQAKKNFLDMFKNMAASQDKQKIWKDFTGYCDSAKSIRKLQEEEGEYAAEMIAQALDAIDVELKSFNPAVHNFYHPIFDKIPAFKEVKSDFSHAMLTFKFLSSKAEQLQALRDELAKTGMRLSIKGRLFDRLSALGDLVFPAKKALSHSILAIFKTGFSNYCEAAQNETDGLELLFQIRIVQSFLKELVLRKSEYEAIKNGLDPLWKKGVLLKDKKEQLLNEAAQKSDLVRKMFEESFEQIKTLVAEQQDGEALKVYEMLSLKLKDRQILKHDFRILKEQLESISSPIFDRMKLKSDQKKAVQKEQETVLSSKKEALVKAMIEAKNIDEKKLALDEAISLNLSLEESYKFKLAYYIALRDSVTSVFEIETLYFEVKKVQEMLRGDLSSSALDFGLSLSLNEINDDLRRLLSDLLAKLD